MKQFALSLLSASLVAANPAALGKRADSVQGFDISGYQTNVDFAGAYDAGARFVMIKATESTTYIDDTFSAHYSGASDAGIIRGGYHFAVPNDSDGASQAEYFLAHGGGWTGDGKTLPGMLDMEYNPYGDDTCFGLSQSDMVSWIQDFADTYNGKTGRYPMIYTTADWWNTCTGGSSAFSQNCPLVLARYASSPGSVPGGWPTYSFWQNSNSYSFGGDSEIWNGSMDSLNKFATG